jgi:hypothetical protein
MTDKQLAALIDHKINEVFLTYQKANNILGGKMSSHDALILKQIKICLADLVTDVCKGGN